MSLPTITNREALLSITDEQITDMKRAGLRLLCRATLADYPRNTLDSAGRMRDMLTAARSRLQDEADGFQPAEPAAFDVDPTMTTDIADTEDDLTNDIADFSQEMADARERLENTPASEQPTPLAEVAVEPAEDTSDEPAVIDPSPIHTDTDTDEGPGDGDTDGADDANTSDNDDARDCVGGGDCDGTPATTPKKRATKKPKAARPKRPSKWDAIASQLWGLRESDEATEIVVTMDQMIEAGISASYRSHRSAWTGKNPSFKAFDRIGVQPRLLKDRESGEMVLSLRQNG